MIIDSIVYIEDSPIFCEAQFQYGNEIYIVCSQGRDILVWDVSERTFAQLYMNPTHDMIMKILRTHPKKYC